MYDFDNSGDGLHPVNDAAWLCPLGTSVTNFVYNQALHIRTWQCEDAYGLLSPICSAAEQWCGDGVVQGGEVCDDGNSNNNDTCKNNCQLQTTIPECGEKDG
jgi:cysteine-rich repeat protein